MTFQEPSEEFSSLHYTKPDSGWLPEDTALYCLALCWTKKYWKMWIDSGKLRHVIRKSKNNLLSCVCILLKWKLLLTPSLLSGRDGALYWWYWSCSTINSVLHSSTETWNLRGCPFLQQSEILLPLRLAWNTLVSVQSRKDGCWLTHYVLQLLSKETHWKKSTTKWNRS